MNKTKILICAASPKNASATQANAQFEAIKEIFAGQTHFEVVSHLAITLEDLRKALAQHEPHIVHFIGHGQETGLVLEDRTGKKEAVSTEQLITVFKKHSKDLDQPIELLFLNACSSYHAAEKLAEKIQCQAIGMREEIESHVARLFAKNFYDILKVGKDSYQEAFTKAKEITFVEDNERFEHIPVFLNKTQSDHPAPPAEPILQIEIFKHEISGKTYTFRARFYTTSPEPREINTKDEETKDRFEKLVIETLLDVIFDPMEINGRLTIEFVLSKDLLDLPVDHYCPPEDFPIGKDHRIIIRSWERWSRTKPFWLNRCHCYWNQNRHRLSQQVSEDCLLWAGQLPNGFYHRLNEGIIFFALTSPPPSQKLIELIKAGAPIIFWVRRSYTEKALQTLKNEILTYRLEQMPEIIRQIRTKIWEKHKDTGHLSLLWEDTARPPPWSVDRSDKGKHQAEVGQKVQIQDDIEDIK